MANNKMEVILLTESQIDNLIDFLEFDFIPMIQKCDDIDNMEYLCDMCDVYKKLKDAKRSFGDGAEE